MGKIAFLIVNFLFLLSYNLYFGGEVTAEQKLPSEILRGEKFTIEVLINKGDREGFAKWQQEIPDGFIASPIETQGATFSFKKQNVKLIWMALPETESFTVSYEIIPEPTVEGSFTFEGKFSYIEENERKDITSVSEEIIIGEGGVLASNDENELEKIETEEEVAVKGEEELTIEDSKESKELELEEGVAALEIADNVPEVKDVVSETTELNKNVISNDQVTDSEGIIIERVITNLNDGNYKVSLRIKKGDNQSFGKVEEYVPPGYIAMEDNSNDGIYSFNNNVMKILWMALPAKNELEVSYLMKSESDELDSATIHGVFSILINEQSYQLAMGPSRFKNYIIMDAEPIVEEDIVAEIPKEEIETIVEAETEEEIIEEITNIPSAETGITYKVQIAAGKNEVSQGYFVKRHNISEQVNTEYHNSWFKYTVGSYLAYKEARDKRNAVWSADNKIDDAFVTAYNSGERISVQEALMISNQNWVK